MRPAAFRKDSRAIRNAFHAGIFLAILGLCVGGVRGAGPAGALAVLVLAATSLASLALARRQRLARLTADRELRRLRDESARQSERLAMVAGRNTETLDHTLSGCQLIGFDWRYLYVNDAVARHGRREKPDLVGRTMMECYPGIENTPVFSVLRQCMEERTPGHMENEFAFPDGTTGWFELSVHPVPEGIFISSLEITDRKRAETNMRRTIDRLQTLRAIDLAILSTTELSFTLKTILEAARARLHFDGGDIRLFRAETLMLEPVATIGSRLHLSPGAPGVRLGQGVTGAAARDRRTVRVPDTAARDHQPDSPRADGDARSLYATPLVAKGRLIGVLTVSFSAPFDADDDWIDFFETIAGQTSMAIESGTLFEELQRSHTDLQLAYDTTIEGWSRALDLRDKETEGHTQRVTEMTVKLARRTGMSEADLCNVRWGALLHDIGKMGVPDHILLKPDKLTDEEWRIMRQHPTFAYELLKPIDYLRNALDIPYCHHEKWDGTGYPRGIKGEEIPPAARIFAVVDVWDAICSDRPYRAGWPEPRALDFIQSVSGTHLDPAAVELFMSVRAEEKRHPSDEHLVER